MVSGRSSTAARKRFTSPRAGPSGEGAGDRRAVVRRREHRLLVRGDRAALVRGEERRAQLHAGGAEGLGGNPAPPVHDAPRGHHRNLDRIDDLRDERHRAHQPTLEAADERGPVPTGLASLRDHRLEAGRLDPARLLHRVRRPHPDQPRARQTLELRRGGQPERHAERRGPALDHGLDLRVQRARGRHGRLGRRESQLGVDGRSSSSIGPGSTGAPSGTSAKRLIPKGRSVRERTSRLHSRICSGVEYAQPRNPRPPARETSAASAGVLGPPAIGAPMSGCSIPSREHSRAGARIGTSVVEGAKGRPPPGAVPPRAALAANRVADDAHVGEGIVRDRAASRDECRADEQRFDAARSGRGGRGVHARSRAPGDGVTSRLRGIGPEPGARRRTEQPAPRSASSRRRRQNIRTELDTSRRRTPAPPPRDRCRCEARRGRAFPRRRASPSREANSPSTAMATSGPRR